MVSRVIPVDDFDLVIFGATGDLAHRKIIPGLFRRFVAGQIPDTAQIIGAARTNQGDEEFRSEAAKSIVEFGGVDKSDPELARSAAAGLCSHRRQGNGRLEGSEIADAQGRDPCLLFLGRAVAFRRYR